MNWSITPHKLRSPWLIVPVLILVSLGLGTFWFFHNFERKEVEIHQGISPAARNNPLLAAERYLIESGQSAVSQRGMNIFSNLPSPNDAILIRHLPGGLSKSISNDLLGWVDSGGHLLLTPNPLRSGHPGSSNILEQLGVKFPESADDSDCGCPPETDTETDSTDAPEISTDNSKNTVDTDLNTAVENEAELHDTLEDEVTDEGDSYHPYSSIIDLDVEGFPIKLESFSPTLLEDTDQSAIYRIDGSYHIEYEEEEDQEREDNFKEVTEEGAWLLQYEVGAGKVTVLSEMSLFYNSYIGEYNHAFFLSWLVQDAAQIWLLYASNADSLLTILWREFTLFWISLFIVVVLVLWKLQKQSGERLRLQSENRLNIMTHIDASGQYHWRTDKLSAIIQANRKTLLHWLAGRKLGHRRDQQNIDINMTSLAAKIGISEDEINEAFQQKIDSEQNLIKTSRALQRIQTLIQGGESTRNDS